MKQFRRWSAVIFRVLHFSAPPSEVQKSETDRVMSGLLGSALALLSTTRARAWALIHSSRDHVNQRTLLMTSLPRHFSTPHRSPAVLLLPIYSSAAPSR